MPDISMCARTDCSLSPHCRRHADSGTVPTPMRQTYAAFAPPGENCRAFWPCEGAAQETPGSAPTASPGTPNSDATAAVTAAASIARPIGPLCSGHSTTMEDGA
jgi:hypothetical protein